MRKKGEEDQSIDRRKIIGTAGSVWVLCSVLVVSSVVMIYVLGGAFHPLLAVAAAKSRFRNYNYYYYFSKEDVPAVQLRNKAVIEAVHGDRRSRAISAFDENAVSLNPSSSFPGPKPLSPMPTLLKKDRQLEAGLARARAAIRKAALNRNSSATSSLSDGIYRNSGAFHQSYIEMEKRFKVYVYEEEFMNPPIVHGGPCKNIYASEGRFIHEMERVGNKFRTRNPDVAHVYFMPFSVTWMVKYLYKPNTYDLKPIKEFVSDYVRIISTNHPFWNRTQGADHFMLSCHDWGPRASEADPFLYNTSIRVMCNANSSEGFNSQKDVSLPEIHLYTGDISPKLMLPLPANSTSRPYLGFFAGGVHGPVRPILLQHWKERDDDLRVYEYLPKGLDYYNFMLQSKFCLCPSGYEVASPRVVEGIYAECVPVLLSDHYVLPFSDVLNWDAFSIQVNISEIPRLKEILQAIPEDQYLRLKQGVKEVRKHFVFNQPPQRFDVFHMILHSVWLRRLNLRLGLTSI